MNFFEQQARAKRQSRWIIIGFFAVTLLIIFAVDAAVWLGLALAQTQESGQPPALNFASVQYHSSALLFSSLLTGGFIALASLGKIASLRSGGGKVAQDMGATLVSPEVRDPLRRRYYNVVEEVAIASGVPVPEVYVMENETGINAFAAGYSPSDAAVAVTQGTLEKLSRSELQGVVAHEFSHILNGDMRLNIRMMGVLFGILVVTIIGRKILRTTLHVRGGSREGNGVIVAIVVSGVVLAVVGSIGLFFSRWMKSALSRQREYLADSSAVQFTRDPDGIAGALKKIAVYKHKSFLKADSEEVSHMLFGSGGKKSLFDTHPPLLKRIKRIQKHFNEEELKDVLAKIERAEKREHAQAAKAAKELEEGKKPLIVDGIFDMADSLTNIGNAGAAHILTASALFASVPDELMSAAHSVEWAPELLFFCLLDQDATVREKQLAIVHEQMGDISTDKLSYLLGLRGALQPNQRLPLLEVGFPALKQRPIEDIEKMTQTIQLLTQADHKVDSFEYLLARLMVLHLEESKYPSRVKAHGNRKIKHCQAELQLVLWVLAEHGHQDTSKTITAYQKGAKLLGLSEAVDVGDNWYRDMDKALHALNDLNLADKKKFVDALAAVVASDGRFVTAEHEMLRAICASIHVPVPVFAKPSGTA